MIVYPGILLIEKTWVTWNRNESCHKCSACRLFQIHLICHLSVASLVLTLYLVTSFTRCSSLCCGSPVSLSSRSSSWASSCGSFHSQTWRRKSHTQCRTDWLRPLEAIVIMAFMSDLLIHVSALVEDLLHNDFKGLVQEELTLRVIDERLMQVMNTGHFLYLPICRC